MKMKKDVCLMFLLLVTTMGFGQEIKEPNIAYINYAINQIIEVDYIRQSFEVDFYFQQYWKLSAQDSIAQHILSDSLTDGDPLVIEELHWIPQNDFTNAISIETIGETNYTYIRGYAMLDVRYKGTFYNEMDLRHFPFDNQHLIIQFEDFSTTINELSYQYGTPFDSIDTDVDTFSIETKSAFVTGMDFSEFSLNSEVLAISHEHEYLYTWKPETYSKLDFVFQISRKNGYYFTKIISISILIVLMSWIVFYMSVTDLNNRANFSITTFLALIAHNFVINDLLPKINYLTTIDYLILGTNILVFATVIESIIVSSIARTSVEKARRIDFFCFMGCIVTLMSICLFTLLESRINA